MKTLVMVVCILCTAYAQNRKAPSFTLKDLEGNTVSFSEYSGKIVVMDFWASWCESCEEGLAEINAIHKEYASKGVAVLGINLEKTTVKHIREVIKKAGVEYRILHDPEGKTPALFGIKGIPALVIVDSYGIIVVKYRGVDKKTTAEVRTILHSLTSVE